MKQLLFISTMLLVIAACSTQHTTPKNQNTEPNLSQIENPANSITLVDHIRRLPGVQVSGSGRDATVTIRGMSSISGSSEPLFVVDGQPVTGGLRVLVDVIPVENIRSITVLKNASETGIYGVRGANGVIDISLKKK